MKVKMLVATYWDGKKLKPGDATDVADAVGERWAKVGVAEKLKPGKPAKKTDTEKE